MKVSVVIPTYNRAATLCEAVGSALEQTHQPFEVIVVDDGSTDDTRAKLDEFTRDSRLRYYRQKQAGVSAARNAAMKQANGDLIAFLDSDDIWKPRKLESDVALFERHPEIDAVFSDVEKRYPDRREDSLIRSYKLFQKVARELSSGGMVVPQRVMYLSLLEEFPIWMPAFTVRRDLPEVAEGFNELLVSGEDWDFALRLARRRLFGYIDSPLAVVRISGDSIHLSHCEENYRGLIGVLGRERRRLARDPEAGAAVRRGIRRFWKMLGWIRLARGRRGGAAWAFLQGAWQCHDLTMLARMLSVWAPAEARRLARGIHRDVVAETGASGQSR